mmetsp:Transcript_25416/g.44712  ORF Transcript_25416/g.44712 Transcript_25416/m.44712 type:complete len:99 (-) Transcript_25416:18-314(-)
MRSIVSDMVVSIMIVPTHKRRQKEIVNLEETFELLLMSREDGRPLHQPRASPRSTAVRVLDGEWNESDCSGSSFLSSVDNLLLLLHPLLYENFPYVNT